MKTKIAILSLVFLTLATFASAAEFLAPDKGNQVNPNVSTAPQETHKNLYAAGATVNINSATFGDLYAAGAVVTVNGNVESDLVVAGGNLNLNGNVGGDARVAGGNISISSLIGSDLVVAGGNVSITSKANVAGDLVAAGGNLVVDSVVSNNAKLSGGNMTINGKIVGNLEVTAQRSLTFGPSSEVLGKVTYKGVKPAVVKEGAKVGKIEFTQIHEKRFGRGVAGLLALGTLIKLLALLVAGFVLLYFFPAKISSVVSIAKMDPLKSLGIGFLALVASPALAIVLFITVIGFYLGILVLLLYFLTLILTSILTLFYVGNLVYGWYKKEAAVNYKRDLIVGAIVILIASLIPYIGWLALFVVYLITLGSLVSYYKNKRQSMA